MTEFSHLTSGEEHLMQLLWQLHTFYLKDVLENHPEPRPHQNTVSTYLKLLAEKKFIRSEKEGRILKYEVVVPRDDYKRFLLKNLVKNYGYTPGEILNNLFSDKIITAGDFSQFFDAKVVVTAKPEILSNDFEGLIYSKNQKNKKRKKSKK